MSEPFSNRLAEDLWTVVRELGKVRNYSKGELLFSAEETTKGVYLVEKGAIRIHFPVPAPKQVFDQSVGPGALLGLSESITGECHKFTAEAWRDSQTCFVERQLFLRFLRQNQLLCLQIVRLLSEDLHYLYHALQCSSRSTPQSRERKLFDPNQSS